MFRSSFPYKSLSLGISFFYISIEDWKEILHKYSEYIHDIYFSPYDLEDYQSRRNVYNFQHLNEIERGKQLSAVLDFARSQGIRLKLVLNSNYFRNVPIDICKTYALYREKFNVDFVTTFVEGAKDIRTSFPDVEIVCSYNQGIKSLSELDSLLGLNVFDYYVLGQRFIRNFDAFRLIHSHGKKVELLVNNGCMHNCVSYCSIPNYCMNNFYKCLQNKGHHALYAESSLFPEELALFYFDSGLIDLYKISCRPIQKQELLDLLASYLTIETKSFIEKDVSNYHLYARLTHFSPFYSRFSFEDLLKFKKNIWEELGYDVLPMVKERKLFDISKRL